MSRSSVCVCCRCWKLHRTMTPLWPTTVNNSWPTMVNHDGHYPPESMTTIYDQPWSTMIKNHEHPWDINKQESLTMRWTMTIKPRLSWPCLPISHLQPLGCCADPPCKVRNARDAIPKAIGFYLVRAAGSTQGTADVWQPKMDDMHRCNNQRYLYVTLCNQS